MPGDKTIGGWDDSFNNFFNYYCCWIKFFLRKGSKYIKKQRWSKTRQQQKVKIIAFKNRDNINNSKFSNCKLSTVFSIL